MADVSAHTYGRKFTKVEVGFEHPSKGEDHCGDCKHFESPGCEIVSGKVEAGDWCRRYTEKK